MSDITIPSEKLPRVTVGENGWMSVQDASFSPATSPKLAKVWALRYLALALFLEAQEEAAAQVSETDKQLAINAEQLYGKPLSQLTDRELEGANLLYEAQQKAGMVEAQSAEAQPSGMVTTTP